MLARIVDDIWRLEIYVHQHLAVGAAFLAKVNGDTLLAIAEGLFQVLIQGQKAVLEPGGVLDQIFCGRIIKANWVVKFVL